MMTLARSRLLRKTLRLGRMLAALAVMLPGVAAAQMPAVSDEPITPVPPPIVSSARRVALGAALFADPRLSSNGIQSCASCHDLQTNGASNERHDRSPDGRPLDLNTNTVFNASLSFRLNWSGDVRTLEDQAAGSIERPDRMGAMIGHVVDELRADPGMAEQFNASYGHAPDRASLLDAIAAFERTLVTPGSRFDLWLAGDHAALTSSELGGYELFKSIGCVSCHQGVNVGGNLFERWGAVDPRLVRDRQMLRVPSLRNVATTPPYFHDGSAPTLQGAVRRMAAAQLGRDLSDQEVSSIVDFLGTLTGHYAGHAVVASR